MKRVLPWVLVLQIAMSVMLGAVTMGCMTIRKGSMQPVLFVSSPIGARVIADGTGSSISTPGRLSLTRDENHYAVVEKEGYESATVSLNRDVSMDVFMNFVCLGGCVICFAVDFISGDAFELKPDPVIVSLVPAHTAPAPASAPEPPP
jgi:hypothetical protein